MLKRITLILLIGSFAPSIALAAYFDGSTLNLMCKEGNPAVSVYVAGVVDDVEFTKELTNQRADYCIPPNMTNGDLGDLLCKFLKENPEKRRYSAAAVTRMAMVKEFFCVQ